MTTLRDRPEPGTRDEPTGDEAAHCPHCGTLMEAGVQLPWPTEPVPCASCDRWVGRARAVPAPSVEASEPEAALRDARVEGQGRRRGARRRAPRLGPSERRRARELGPPPVPRFASDGDEPEADLDLADDGFANTGVWDAVGQQREPDRPGPPAASETTRAPESSTEFWSPPDHHPDGASGSSPIANDAPAFGAAPTELDRDIPPQSERYEDDGDLGPPAPFYVPTPAAASGHNGNGNGTAPPPAAAEPLAPEQSPADAEPHSPPAPLRPGSGHTLPFWSVPSEPERPKRRFSLKKLRRPRLRRPTRAGLMRALPFALLAVGGLLLIEGALTVFWKEPFSALFAAQTQSSLGDDLDKLERDGAAAAAAAQGAKAAEAYQRRRSVALNRDAGISEPVGRLKVPKINLNEVVVQGTDEEVSLTKGPGHYTETPLPGQKGNWTVGIAGHRTTYGAPFRDINKLKKGDEIVFSTPYGRFTYAVEGPKIVDDSETGVFQPKGYDRIALTACHPLYSAAQRIIAYGRLTKSEPLGKARRAARS